MAKSLATVNGTAYIPGGYASFKVQNNPGGLATTGVLFLIGESDAGPVYSLESDLETNSYGPDQLADVINKYKSGPIVDAFRGAVAAVNDPNITGSFSRAIIAKTNTSVKASGSLVNVAAGTYATIADKAWGRLGNQIQVSVVQTQAETPPSFAFVPPTTATTAFINTRINGGAIGTPAAIATAFVQGTTDGTLPSGVTLTGMTGGVSRGMLTTATGTLAATFVGSVVTFTRSVAWDITPSVGDSLLASATGTWAVGGGANTANITGWYIITAVTSTTIVATKVVGTAPTAPVVAAAFPAGALVAFSPFAITSATLIDGVGKSVEVFTTGTTVGTVAYSGTTAVQSTSTVPYIITSGTEQRITLNASRASDLASESFLVGGELPFQIGYLGTTATVTITDTTLTTTVTGGAGTSLSLTLSDYPSIQSLCDYISTQAGYKAAPGTASLGLQSPVNLDTVTSAGCASQFGTVMPGRVKWDAYKLNKAIADGSQLVQLGTGTNVTVAAGAGLPQVQSAFYLAGGARGGTSDTNVVNALAALEQVRGNFVIPLFSRNAAGLDITDGITDTSSTYTLAGVQAAVKAHVLTMSTWKRRKNRQALLSVQDSFANQKTLAANTASFRCNMAFQNVKDLSGLGVITTFQPWMGAVKAASMQAAGFYQSIEYKGILCSGVTHAAGDFDPRNDTNLEDALLAGLMPIRRLPTGGFVWVSDQTTYGKDDNFVFNSLQAVYAADTVALTSAQRMEAAFVGQSVADINKNVALAYFESIMDDMRRLKLITPSDDALKGFRNVTIRISANSLLVSAEIKLTTAIDFVSIDFLVAPVQQST